VARDGLPPHAAHLNYLHEEAARRNLPLAKFSAKKGDVLLWHAELPHGGGEINKPGRTRRSLVTHYCPKALMPHHWGSIPEEWRRKTEVRGGHAFISSIFPPPEQYAAKQ
jgi:phytanoyl-CoA hydroxylase